MEQWYLLENEKEVLSPSLLLYPDRIEANLRQMVRIAGGTERLRPHVKTHKLGEIVRMQLNLGISKFKCATIAEAEMVAAAGAMDVLLAHQPTGPNILRLLDLNRKYSECRFSTIADDAGIVDELSDAFNGLGIQLPVYLDVDCGMHRSGIVPGSAAAAIYKRLVDSEGLEAAGLHVYDGHNNALDFDERKRLCDEEFSHIANFKEQLEKEGLAVPNMVAGGTPTFPVHAKCMDRECSPGTTVLWDFGYERYSDLDFQVAAVLLTRVISKPSSDCLCLDLGHKAVAPDKPQPRVKLYDLPDAVPQLHSEEHLTVETSFAERYSVGDCCYAVPVHICPTVALHDEVLIVRNGKVEESWAVEARRRRISF